MRPLLGALLVVISAGVAAQTAMPKELELFQGPWVLTSAAGSPVPAGMAGMIFTGDKYQGLSSGIVDERGSIKLNPATKPMQIDLIITEGKDAGKIQLGLVDIADDTMTLILANPGDKIRPTAPSADKLILKKLKL